jgi:hypothetical protein
MNDEQRNKKRERAAVTEQLASWGYYVDSPAYRAAIVDGMTVADVATMTTAQYNALACTAYYGARRGRLAIGAGKRDTLTLPAPDPMEDIDTVLDAIEALYSQAIKDPASIRTVGGFVYNAARARAKRRGIHRIRESGSLLVEPATDHKAPPIYRWTVRDEDGVGVECEAGDLADVVEQCTPSKRPSLLLAANRWKQGKDKNRTALRDIRRALDIKPKDEDDVRQFPVLEVCVDCTGREVWQRDRATLVTCDRHAKQRRDDINALLQGTGYVIA